MKNEALEMIKTRLSVFRMATFCLPLMLVASCGSGGPEGVQGTIINFDPPSLGTLTLDIETIDSVDGVQTFRIEARSPSGYPQIGVDVLIRSAFAVYAGHPAVVCSSDAAVPVTITCTAPGATPLDLGQLVQTGQNGTYEVTVIFTTSPAITGDITLIEAFSGTGYNFATITVACGDSVDPDQCL